MGGVYSYNKRFDTFYVKGAQDLAGLEDDVNAEASTTANLYEKFQDYLPGGWPDFIKDFCE